MYTFRGIIMSHNSLSLGEHLTSFIDQQVFDGRYGCANDVICAGLRLLEEQEAKVRTLRNALIEGEHSGSPQPIDEHEFLKEMRIRHVR
jgi:antitoxin ParD1/3/4